MRGASVSSMCKESGRLRAVCEATPASYYWQPLTSVPKAPALFYFHAWVDNPMQCAMRLTMQALETHGDKAVVVAAKRACSFEEKGNSEEATTWRKIEAAIKLMRGPRQS